MDDLPYSLEHVPPLGLCAAFAPKGDEGIWKKQSVAKL